MDKKICVIGGGPGGYVAAIRLAQLGKKAVVIEKEEIGGTCLNHGCIPSKIMKATSSLFSKTKEFKNFGIILDSAPKLDLSQLQSKKEKILQSQRKGIESILNHHGIELIKGEASFKDDKILQIHTPDNEILNMQFEYCIIASGTTASTVPSFEFDHEKIISSNDLLALESIPGSITIIGGGIIGCEFASILAEMGSKVSLIEARERILPIKGLEPEISKDLEREFKKKKIKVYKNCSATLVHSDSNMLKLSLTEKGTEKEVECEKIAVCTGRKSLSNLLNLKNAGVSTDEKGWIITDKNYKTSNQKIYAIGDILGPKFSMLAHTASFEGRIAAENITGTNTTKLNYQNIPGAIFTTPEIGFIGLSEEIATEKEIQVLKEKILFRTSGKAHAIGEIAGEAIIIAEKKSKKIIGIHIIGPHASDLLGEASVLVQQNVDFISLANTVHAHPTLSEILMETGLKLAGMGIHG